MLDAVNGLSFGEVISYADLVARAGRPGAARAAGRLLTTVDDQVPWWRVVYSDGRLAPCHPAEQQERLEREGVTVVDGKVRQSPRGRVET